MELCVTENVLSLVDPQNCTLEYGKEEAQYSIIDHVLQKVVVVGTRGECIDFLNNEF